MRRWQDWTPKTKRIGIPPDNEPTRPTIPGYVGFGGALPATSRKIQPSPEAKQASSSPSPTANFDGPDSLQIAEKGTNKTYRTPAQVTTNAYGQGGRASAELPTRRCRACNSWLFWVSVYGVVVCSTCHPPASRDLVKTWYWLPEIECKKAHECVGG